MKRALILLAVSSLALAAAAACGDDDDDGGAKTTTLGGQTFNDHGTVDARGKDSAEFELDDFYFNPTFIRANAGQKVTLQLKNEGKATHNFSFAAASVDQDIPPEGNANITITMPANGVALIFCKIHKSQGMAGELLVGDASPAAP
jgi:plastocyanin